MEQAVLFRQQLILGRVARYQGDFLKSLSHLKTSQHITDVVNGLIFLEDGGDLACNLADTYLELDDPVKAESCLRAEIERQGPKQAALIISLADSFFAQRRSIEVEDTLCLASQPHLKVTVQVMRPQERIIGIYLQLGDANDSAVSYLHREHGISASEISDKLGRFGQAAIVDTGIKATQRIWPITGTIKLLTCGGQPWVRVLRKDWVGATAPSSDSRASRPEVYLSWRRPMGYL